MFTRHWAKVGCHLAKRLQSRLDALDIVGLIVDATCQDELAPGARRDLQRVLDTLLRRDAPGVEQVARLRRLRAKRDTLNRDAVVDHSVDAANWGVGGGAGL